ncbi:hypothetical protein [Ectobacillus funiculus]|uniref:hypothetical protein n=1 Tax=Ectobacillus funiculus TaxID=137993 RepID=UPI00101DA294|nr:hypothetical protein [Ectobacillus funiculus]
MLPKVAANVHLALMNTRQAIFFAKSALSIFQQLIPPNPVKIALYEAAIDSLTTAFITIQTFLTDPDLSDDSIIPLNLVFPPFEDNQLIIKVSGNQTVLAMDKTNDAIKYIETALSLLRVSETDIPHSLALARLDLVSTRDVLITVLEP